MMRKDPLLIVLDLAQDAEQQASLQMRSAQLDWQKACDQLGALNQYRLDYMKQLDDKIGQQISASFYQQFYRFIKQIDGAIEQQNNHVNQTNTIKEHRQQHWLEKQQKRKGIESLLEKKKQRQIVLENKREQKMIDEFAINQFLRQAR